MQVDIDTFGYFCHFSIIKVEKKEIYIRRLLKV